MLIHNTTFMIERSREEEFISWLRGRVRDLGNISKPRISVMLEAGGMDCTHADGQSVAFQCEFESLEKALDWRATELANLLTDFMKEFGPEAMTFMSVFGEISL